ncbi:hypothetical protein M9H77_22145 [Catharanthus roseus]|uniref:Uncharacterized protein n=1 Tax=Catharanthus roseus TaxID=4058 RepID=A0ACC0AS71_CATRO|nr:hypothetical protein M9H77_22145 [Catharanthus roseus]
MLDSKPSADEIQEAETDNETKFGKSLMELKDLCSQLHHAANYCEATFLNAKEKRASVVENTKEYLCRAVVTVVDHLGSVSANLECRISKTNSFSDAELRIDSLKQSFEGNREAGGGGGSTGKSMQFLAEEEVPLFLYTYNMKPCLLENSKSEKISTSPTPPVFPVRSGLTTTPNPQHRYFQFQESPNVKKRMLLNMKFKVQNKDLMSLMRRDSVFAHVVRAPEDPILGVTVAYNKDPSPNKLNLGVGAYRTEEGKPLVLNVVRRAEQMLVNDQSRVKEYLPIVGLADFNKLSAKLIFGADSPAIQENRVTTVQCLSGTGSLRVGAEFLARHYHERTIYIPVPTWGNHPKVFTLAGLTVKTYRYYNPATRGLDFEGLLEDLSAAPSRAIVLLHACAHNPTGVDPTLEQWEQIRKLMRSKAMLPFFDSAYQGFASGSLDGDAQSVRMFVADGGECLAAQSYAKNMGLYGERVGALSIEQIEIPVVSVVVGVKERRNSFKDILVLFVRVPRLMYFCHDSQVCKSADVSAKVESQLKLVIRPMYSNPPIHGASIVATILKDSNMYHEWTVELKAMADRIISMRQQLFNALQAKGTPGDWSHIIKQIGMFTFTGLNAEQVAFMTKEYHIYMTSDGRISMAGLSSRTVPHLVDAIHAAVTTLG